jgi:uncharacterized membrane protein YfcA
MEIIGFACALIIGLILGLLGGGGSILTVPVLVYINGFHPVTATAYSLFIVGATSAVGTVQNIQNRTAQFRTGLLFAIPSLVGVFLSRKFLVPAIPDDIFTIGAYTLSKGALLMSVFAVVISLAAFSMLRKPDDENDGGRRNRFTLLVQTFFAGIVVGLVGAGGGFLFIPLLIHVARLPMKKAAATSLLIIAINSLVGFLGDATHTKIHWGFLLFFTAISIVGIFIGIYLSRFVKGAQLKKTFGWFILVMAAFILVEEFML